MKKIAFMFVAAALVAACGGKGGEQQVVEPVMPDTAAIEAQFVDFVYDLTAEDSAALAVEGVDTLDAAAVAELIAGKKAEAIAAALQAEYDKLNAPAPAEGEEEPAPAE